MTLRGKTVVITGASRGIGRSIALRCARDGANIVIAAKSIEEGGKLPGTIFSVAKEVEECGGKALGVQVDVRDNESLESMATQAAEEFGGIDILVNNAGAIRLTSTAETLPKFYDLMQAVNTRATFMATRACLPYLEKSKIAHVLNLSPPISFDARWLQNNVAYTISKYGMTLCTLGMSAEFADKDICVNSLWPRTTIDTAAVSMLMGNTAWQHSRKPDIIADAAYEIFSSRVTGQTLIDEDFLRSRGVSDFTKYACQPGTELFPDFYVD